MTDLLFQKDSYIKEFDAEIIEIGENYVVLDKTAFAPRAGGLEGDQGVIVCNGKEYKVMEVLKEGDKVKHILESIEELEMGQKIHGVIDWEKRYKQMRLHTAAHIVSAIFYKRYGALVTGGHITPEKAKELYDLEKLTEEMIEEVFKEANAIVEKGIPVNIKFLEREEALKIPGIVKLASKMPPNIKIWRIVEIPGVDVQADGGPHVKNTKEVGEIVFLKKENKGKGKKAVVFTVKD